VVYILYINIKFSVSVGSHNVGFLHAGPNFRKPVLGTICHTQRVACGFGNLLANDLVV